MRYVLNAETFSSGVSAALLYHFRIDNPDRNGVRILHTKCIFLAKETPSLSPLESSFFLQNSDGSPFTFPASDWTGVIVSVTVLFVVIVVLSVAIAYYRYH